MDGGKDLAEAGSFLLWQAGGVAVRTALQMAGQGCGCAEYGCAECGCADGSAGGGLGMRWETHLGRTGATLR